MASLQGAKQESFQAIHGGELAAHSVAVPSGINGVLIAWLQLRLDSTSPSLPGLMTEFAAAENVANFNAVGAFDPTPEPE